MLQYFIDNAHIGMIDMKKKFDMVMAKVVLVRHGMSLVCVSFFCGSVQSPLHVLLPDPGIVIPVRKPFGPLFCTYQNISKHPYLDFICT